VYRGFCWIELDFLIGKGWMKHPDVRWRPWDEGLVDGETESSNELLNLAEIPYQS